MPRSTDSDSLSQLCKRCGFMAGDVVVRSEPQCRSCFTTFVRTRIIKRLESFRPQRLVVATPGTIVLPISFGICSISLLDTVSNWLIHQSRNCRGTPAYRLHVIHVVHTGNPFSDSDRSIITRLKARYSQHSFSLLSLSSIFLKQASPLPTLEDDFLDLPETENDEMLLGLQELQALLGNTPSATSRADLISVLLIRLIVRFTKLSNYDGIFWGHCTTKLAETVLSESAKGRGFALPWLVTDGDTPYAVQFHYPLRHLLKKELLDYVSMTEPSLRELVHDHAFLPAQAPISSKSTTIDMLMKHYFESIEESHPSIVSNVVQICNKLQVSVISRERCHLCHLPATSLQFPNHDSMKQSVSPSDPRLCYACAQTIPDTCIPLLPN